MKKFGRCSLVMLLCVAMLAISFGTAMGVEKPGFRVHAADITETATVVGDAGGASVVIDGVTITGSGYWGDIPDGSIFEVTKKEVSYPQPGNHGEIVDSDVYLVNFKTSTGQGISSSSPCSISVSNSATSKDISPLNGQPKEVVFNEVWQECSDTFLSTGGKYSIGYILQNYNVFLSKNYNGTHVVGPVVVGGSTSVSLGGITVQPIVNYPHAVPSYVNSYTGGYRQVITSSAVPLYLGKSEEFNNWLLVDKDLAATTGEYYYTSNFIDFDAAFAAIKSEMSTFTGGTPLTVNGNDSVTQAYCGKPGYIDVLLGGTYTVSAEELAKATLLNFYTLDGSAPSGTEDTIIIIEDETVALPDAGLNNYATAFASTESSQASIVYLTPNATSVTGKIVTGHLVAPNADVDYPGGEYNGCVIAKSLKAGEGHMWPYNGSLLSASNGFTAHKTVDGNTPTDAQTFNFTLDELINGSWSNIQTKQNSGGDIVFDELTYNTAGTHWYRIKESTTGAAVGYDIDTKEYLVRTVVTEDSGNLSTENTYYSVNGSVTLSGGAVDETNITALSGNSNVIFNNTTAVVNISGVKTWDDNDNAGNTRPESITIKLMNGTSQVDSQTVTSDTGGDWKWSFTGLPKYDTDGNEINYTVVEDNVPNCYESVVSDDGSEIVNKIKSIAVTKTDNLADGVKAVKGQTIEYTIAVTNNGRADLTDVIVSEPLNGAFADALDSSYTVTNQKTATIASLPVGQTVNLTFNYTVDDGDVLKPSEGQKASDVAAASKISNTVTVTGGITKTATEETPTGYKDIEVIKTADKTSGAKAGDEITYTITVKNTGNIALTNVQLNDSLAGGTLTSADTGVTITRTSAAIASLNVDETKTFTYKYTVTADDVASTSGKVENTATATDGDVTDSSTATTLTQKPGASVAIQKLVCKTADGDFTESVSVNAGEKVYFKIIVTNDGEAALNNVVLTDTFVKASVAGGLDTSAWSSVLGGCPTTLAAGASWTSGVMEYTVPVTTTDGEVFTNTATVNAENALNSNDKVSDNDSATVNAARNYSLEITKSVNTDKVVPGMHVTYTIIVKNTGDATLYNVSVNDDMLKNAGFGTWPVTIDELAPNATKTLDQGYVIPDSANQGDTITNTATASAVNPDHPGDRTKDLTDSADVDVTVVSLESLDGGNKPVLEKKVEGVKEYEADGGETVHYTLYVTNNTDIDFKNLVVYDPMLDAVKNIDRLNSGSDPWSCTDDDTAYLVPRNTEGGDEINNTAYLFWKKDFDASNPDLTKAIDTSSAKVTVKENPELTLTKNSTSATVAAGEKALFTIAVTNTGNCTLTNVVVEDVLSGTWKLESSNTNLSINSADNTVVVATLEPGDCENLAFEYTVPAGTASGSKITNTATATATDPTDSTKTLSADDDAEVTTFMQGLTVVKTADRDEVQVGDKVKFIITITNTGDNTLTDIEVTDTKPVEYDGTAYEAGEVITTIASLAPDDDPVELETYYTVTAADLEAEKITNTATATAENGVTHSDSDEVDVVETPTSDFSITKSANVTEAVAGDVIRYTIIVANTGEAALKNIAVTDSLDVVFGEDTVKAGSVIKTIASLNPDESESINVSYTVPEGLTGKKLTNTAKAKPDGLDEKTASCDVNVKDADAPSYEITKTANVDKGYSGDKVSYVISVKNTGNCELKDVKVTDKMLNFECTVKSIPVGETWTSAGKYDLSYTVPDSDKETMIYNVAKADAPGATATDSQPAAVNNLGKVRGDTDQIVPNTGSDRPVNWALVSAFAILFAAAVTAALIITKKKRGVCTVK